MDVPVKTASGLPRLTIMARYWVTPIMKGFL